MSKLKIAIIGCGGIANNKHFPALSAQSDKCEMVAFVILKLNAPKRLAKSMGWKVRNIMRTIVSF